MPCTTCLSRSWGRPVRPSSTRPRSFFPRGHAAVELLESATQRAARAKWGAEADAICASLRAPDELAVHDGNSRLASQGYAGNLYLSASNALRPLVIDRDNSPLDAGSGKPYCGCYVDAVVDIWAQDGRYGRRISASLLAVRFVRDGERLSHAR